MLTIAHRGASAVAPENTLASFQRAIEIGTDLIELDVRLSRDGAVVVFHDRDLSRTTDGKGPVNLLSLAELKRLDAGGWFSVQFRGERIPTLQETIEAISPGRTGLCIELKIDPGEEAGREELVGKVIDIIEKMNFSGRASLASFDRECASLVKKLAPSLDFGLIFAEAAVWKECADSGYENTDYLSARWSIVTRPRVETAQRAGRRVITWTIDREKELNQVLRGGVDGVASNNPAWLVGALQKEK